MYFRIAKNKIISGRDVMLLLMAVVCFFIVFIGFYFMYQGFQMANQGLDKIAEQYIFAGGSMVIVGAGLIMVMGVIGAFSSS